MFKSTLALLALVVGHASITEAEVNWSADEVNTTMCVWKQPRGNHPRRFNPRVRCLDTTPPH
jgi:hypothetical protein